MVVFLRARKLTLHRQSASLMYSRRHSSNMNISILTQDKTCQSKHNNVVYVILQATLIIRDLTLRVFAVTRFRGKKAVRKLYITILQSPCTVVAWLCDAHTSWSHLTSISVRGSVELASPVDVEHSLFIFKAMGKTSRPNCYKNGCKCKKQRKL
jgi:hypothetical protein